MNNPLNRAQFLIEQSKWEPAEAELRRVLTEFPQLAQAHSLLAICLSQKEDYKQATHEAQEAIHLAPDDWFSHYTMANVFCRRNREKEAREVVEEALRLNPGLDWARQGMVLALKARNPFYRLVLGYFLWVSKLGTKMQWALIIGLYLGYRSLGTIGENVPALEPYLGLIAFAYIAFVMISWLADPLFNLLLRTDRFGRYVLSPDQIKGANLFGACLLAAVVCFVVALFVDSPVLILATLAFALLSIPSSAVFRCDAGWPRQAMALYTAGVGLLGLVALIGIAAEIENLSICGPLFFIGVLASTWVANGLITATPRY